MGNSSAIQEATFLAQKLLRKVSGSPFKNPEGVYRYRVFGLNLASELRLRHLPVCDGGDIDVRILQRPIVRPPGLARNWHLGADGGLYTWVHEIACYHVTPSQILVHPLGGDPAAVELYLCGSVFGSLIYQRGGLPLHGCSVVVDDAARTYLGESGSGKSTLAGSFHKAGHLLLSDDVSAVFFDAGRPLVQPSPTRLRLLPDAAASLGLVSHQEHEPISAKVILDLFGGFSTCATSLSEISILARGPRSKCLLRDAEPLRGLLQHLYRPEMVELLNLDCHVFGLLAGLAKQPCYALFLPEVEDPHDLAEMAV